MTCATAVPLLLTTAGAVVLLKRTFWAAMAFGLPELGKVPGVWSGTPLPVMVRWVPLQLMAAVLTRFRKVFITLWLNEHMTPLVPVEAVVVPEPVVVVADPVLVVLVGVTVIAADGEPVP